MKIIVTGGSGRAGRFTLQELVDAGHEVVNLDRVRPSEPLPCRSIWLDLTDAGEVYDAMAQIDPDCRLPFGSQSIAQRLSPPANLCQQRDQYL